MSDSIFLAYCFAHYFRIVLRTAEPGKLRLLDYEHTRDAARFPDTLARGLGLQPEATELEIMLKQFRYYSKDDTKSILYAGEPSDLLDRLDSQQRQAILDICGDELARLDQSPQNLYPRIRTEI